MKQLVLILIFVSSFAAAEELPANAKLVRTVFIFPNHSLSVQVFQNDDTGFLVLERFRVEGRDIITDEIVAIEETEQPRADSWFTHFMDCNYLSGEPSEAQLISEVRFSERDNPDTATNFPPAKAWLVDPADLTITDEDPAGIRCRPSLP